MGKILPFKLKVTHDDIRSFEEQLFLLEFEKLRKTMSELSCELYVLKQRLLDKQM